MADVFLPPEQPPKGAATIQRLLIFGAVAGAFVAAALVATLLLRYTSATEQHDARPKIDAHASRNAEESILRVLDSRLSPLVFRATNTTDGFVLNCTMDYFAKKMDDCDPQGDIPPETVVTDRAILEAELLLQEPGTVSYEARKYVAPGWKIDRLFLRIIFDRMGRPRLPQAAQLHAIGTDGQRHEIPIASIAPTDSAPMDNLPPAWRLPVMSPDANAEATSASDASTSSVHADNSAICEPVGPCSSLLSSLREKIAALKRCSPEWGTRTATLTLSKGGAVTATVSPSYQTSDSAAAFSNCVTETIGRLAPRLECDCSVSFRVTKGH